MLAAVTYGRAACAAYILCMEHSETTVIYNGACPICSREIAGYRSHAARHDLPIRFTDLNSADLARWDLTADQAARRLYVEQDGQLLSGVPAFALLWARMPGFRWLARLVRLPGVRWVAAVVYDRVLAPLLYRMHTRRQSRLGKGAPQG